MTEEEKSSLLAGESEGGLYCPGCPGCADRCAKGLPLPDIMRAYMYTYGYGDAKMGKHLLADLKIAGSPCEGCPECTVTCPRGFDVAGRVRDIVRLTSVPTEFLL
jgi:predicted aldo/keto reductase-like oxidoreductase